VMNKQRQAVYGMRRQLLEGKDQSERIKEIIQGIVASFSDIRCPERAHASTYDLTGLQSDVLSQFGVKIDLEELNGLLKQEVEDHINDLLERRFKEKEELIGPENMREAECIVMLNVIDNQWKDHLLSMDHLKEGIGLRGYGQKDPLIEYKKESFELFQDMMDRIEDETIRYLFFLQVTTGPAPGESGNGGGPGGLPERPKPVLPFSDEDDEDDEDEDSEEALVSASSEERRAAQSSVENFTRNIQRKKDKEMAALQFAGGSDATAEKKQAVSDKKAGRNDPCPCGSGKKYKKCHGA
jgi:preprotein translocase subunit SecA